MVALFPEHLGGLFRRPRVGEACRAGGQAIRSERQETCLPDRHLGVDCFECIGGGVVSLIIVRRILVDFDPGQADKTAGTAVGGKLGFVLSTWTGWRKTACLGRRPLQKPGRVAAVETVRESLLYAYWAGT